MITKKDWQQALDMYRANLVNAEVNIEGYRFMVDTIEKRIADLKEEDPMPEDIKEVIKEVVK